VKKLLVITTAAVLACASRQNTSSDTSMATSGAEDRATVIQPSSLSPEQVRLVQRSLVDRGFAVDLSGSFDQPTQSALSEFQRARGLPATGNLNTPTMDALGLDPRDVMPVRGDAGAADATGRSTAPATGATPGTGAPGTSAIPGPDAAPPPAPPASEAPGSPGSPRSGY
jgi:peptidoglycan hydrolase-like protein with peptidoglycan-binding domain